MKAYNIDNNGYLINEVDCQMSPREPGKYLIPKNAITEPLPFKPQENETFKWEDKWVLKPDFSGVPYFNKSNKSIRYFEIGEEFDNNYTNLPPISDESVFRDGVWVEDDRLKRINELKVARTGLIREVSNLDIKSIRSIRSYIIHNKEEDKDFLMSIETQILSARKKIKDIDAEMLRLESDNV